MKKNQVYKVHWLHSFTVTCQFIFKVYLYPVFLCKWRLKATHIIHRPSYFLDNKLVRWIRMRKWLAQSHQVSLPGRIGDTNLDLPNTRLTLLTTAPHLFSTGSLTIRVSIALFSPFNYKTSYPAFTRINIQYFLVHELRISVCSDLFSGCPRNSQNFI